MNKSTLLEFNNNPRVHKTSNVWFKNFNSLLFILAQDTHFERMQLFSKQISSLIQLDMLIQFNTEYLLWERS